jgi:uroporphyrinogen decarboxylase
MNDRFLRACRGQPVDTTPVWIMRQAGRYLPEYRAVRAQTTFLGLCKTPELAATVTVQPVDLLGVDAAILFSDILIPVEAMGVPLEFHEQEGPVLPRPVRTAEDVRRLARFDPTVETSFTLAAIRQTNAALQDRVPLIGFAGAPFTLAAYMVEGGGSKSWLGIKKLMFQEPGIARELFTRITDAIGDYLLAQLEAGCHAVQIFDSWGGELGPAEFETWTLPHVSRLVQMVKSRFPQAPVIYFGTGMSTLLERMKRTGADVIGLDWRIELDLARARLGPDVAVQGNLDPAALFLPHADLTERIKDVMDRNAGRPGHVFNLGHGITPPTDPAAARHLVSEVHRLGRRG